MSSYDNIYTTESSVFATEEVGIHAIVNLVNTKGYMNRGIPLQFKKRFPRMFEEYKDMCAKGTFKVGTLHVHTISGYPYVINLPTRDKGCGIKIENIEIGLHLLVKVINALALRSIAIPNAFRVIDPSDFYQSIYKILGPIYYTKVIVCKHRE